MTQKLEGCGLCWRLQRQCTYHALMRTVLLGLCLPLWVVTLSACMFGPTKPPAPVEPPQAREACEAFCELRVTLECDDTGDSPGPDEIDGTADDVPCARVCRDFVTEGSYAPVRSCLETARTCGATEECIFGRST